jgi:hypothetical protein
MLMLGVSDCCSAAAAAGVAAVAAAALLPLLPLLKGMSRQPPSSPEVRQLIC